MSTISRLDEARERAHDQHRATHYRGPRPLTHARTRDYDIGHPRAVSSRIRPYVRGDDLPPAA